MLCIADYIKQNRKMITVFIVIGGASMLLNLVVFNLMLEITQCGYLVDAGAAYFIATVFNFFANRNLNFNSKNSLAASIWRYLVMLGINYLGTVLVITMASEFFGLNQRVGQFIGIAIMTIVNFILSKHWIFASVQKGAV